MNPLLIARVGTLGVPTGAGMLDVVRSRTAGRRWRTAASTGITESRASAGTGAKRMGRGCRGVSTIVPALIAVAGSVVPCQAAAQNTAWASVRARWETWDWFNAAGDGSYNYFGVLARAGIRVDRPRIGGTLEASAPMLFGLPDAAVAPAPQGQLGLGAAYRTANQDGANSGGL